MPPSWMIGVVVPERVAAEIAEAERTAGIPAGTVVRLLDAWHGVRRLPGNPLILPVPACPCPTCDPVGARRELAELLPGLPRRIRGLVGAHLTPIDRWYADRTLPDPTSDSPHWFERRLTDQNGW